MAAHYLLTNLNTLLRVARLLTLLGTLMTSNRQHPVHLAHLLSDPFVDSLLLTHPNRVLQPSFVPPAHWSSWWNNASLNWLTLVRAYTSRVRAYLVKRLTNILSEQDTSARLCDELAWTIDTVRRLQLAREPAVLPGISVDISQCQSNLKPSSTADVPGSSIVPQSSGPGVYGMSPKKNHEVNRMITYIHHLISRESVRHIVDVGAGQGYLSRALKENFNLHVLAIDSNDLQTQSAERWDRKVNKRSREKTRQEHSSDQGSLEHKTIHITPDTLRASIDDWISESGHLVDREPVPVLIVALHACGSLTPDILRCFLANTREGARARSRWKPWGAVVVGCCYNLMSENDFPLSKALSTSPYSPRLSLYRSHTFTPCTCGTSPRGRYPHPHQLTLTENHVQLAAQVPSQWMRTPQTLQDAELAMRKVVWRAMLGRWVGLVEGRDSHPGDNNTEEKAGRPQARLGKLNNAAYKDWNTFLRAASEKMGVQFPEDAFAENLHSTSESEDRGERNVLEMRLEVLYVMRCLLGPAVESLILLDRVVWVREELGEGEGEGDSNMEVELVNLFDQAEGSGRNVAIIISPRS